MAQDLHPPPPPPASVPTNGVRLCEARLDKGDPCNRPTKGTQYRYCPPHYSVYKERTEEYKAQSGRVLQMKNQARVRVCVRPGAAKAMLNVADVDAAVALVEEWRAGIEKEVRMRERHTVQFFDGIVDEGHGKWMDSLAGDQLEASDILNQLKTRRDEIMAAAKASGVPDCEREVGDHFARTANDSTAITEPDSMDLLGIVRVALSKIVATTTNSPADPIAISTSAQSGERTRDYARYRSRTYPEGTRRRTRPSRTSEPPDATSPSCELPDTKRMGANMLDLGLGLLGHGLLSYAFRSNVDPLLESCEVDADVETRRGEAVSGGCTLQ